MTPKPPTEPTVAEILAALPQFYDWRRLHADFGGWDRLIDAYCLGQLDQKAESVLETTCGERLQVQLLRRLIRLTLEGRTAR